MHVQGQLQVVGSVLSGAQVCFGVRRFAFSTPLCEEAAASMNEGIGHESSFQDFTRISFSSGAFCK